MRFRVLVSSILLAGLSGGASAAAHDIPPGVTDGILGTTGNSPSLTLVEKGAYALIESALSTVAGVLQLASCGAFDDPPVSRRLEVEVNDVSGEIRTAVAGSYALLDGVTYYITDEDHGSNKGTLLEIQKVSVGGSDRIQNHLVVSYVTRRVPVLGSSPPETQPGFGFDKGGSMAYASADMVIRDYNDQVFPPQDGAFNPLDEHIIKDFWKRCTRPGDGVPQACPPNTTPLPPEPGSELDAQVVDFGLELITKNNLPRSKYEQSSLYRRPNGDDGWMWMVKTKIAPNIGTLCQIQLTLEVDKTSGPTTWYGEGDVLTLAVPAAP